MEPEILVIFSHLKTAFEAKDEERIKAIIKELLKTGV
jgi:hypothetical protein